VASREQTAGVLYKTSVVFSLAEGPGNLFKALSVFALRDIDMTKIQSRPLRAKPLVVSKDGQRMQLNYLFYVDVLGSLAEEKCQNALKHLQEIAPFLRVLGSYPADNETLQV
jgi:arogenate/prephenate dehydratase